LKLFVGKVRGLVGAGKGFIDFIKRLAERSGEDMGKGKKN